MSEGVIDETVGRVYHGVADDRDGHNARILVMDSGCHGNTHEGRSSFTSKAGGSF